MSTPVRRLIVVDKNWECDPICWALTNSYLNDNCGVKLPWPKLVNYPSYGPVPQPPAPQRPAPRLMYVTDTVQIEVWCISDLLSGLAPTPANQSSSQKKMEMMGKAFSYDTTKKIDMVISACTASSGPFCPPYQGQVQTDVNGSVIVGTEVFVHDGHPVSDPNPDSQWRWPYFDQLMKSAYSIDQIKGKLNLQNLETALLCPPNNPATNGQHIYLDNDDRAAISLVNVTNYAEYASKDTEAGNAFLGKCPGNPNGVSLETTHGLVYAAARAHFGDVNPPFIFVSGITDRYGKFNEDVGPKVYAQNTTCAHNAGVLLALWISQMV